MAVIDDLIAAKANVSGQLAAMTVSPKPTYSINGQSVTWQSHFDSLVTKLENLNKLIQVEAGPLQFETVGIT